MRAHEALAAGVALAELVASMLLVYATIEPLLLLSGSISGYIALSHYSIRLLGEPLESHVLDYVAYTSIALYVASTLGLASSMYALATLAGYGDPRVAFGSVYGSTLATIVAYGYARALVALAATELSHIKVFNVRTSAGIIEFPKTTIEATAAYKLLNAPHTMALLAVLVAAAAVLAYDASRGGKQPRGEQLIRRVQR